jgi:cilia- and flagella-associated protein 298
LEVIELEHASLWWAGKEMVRGKKLCDFIGRNEKTKVLCKLQKASFIVVVFFTPT